MERKQVKIIGYTSDSVYRTKKQTGRSPRKRCCYCETKLTQANFTKDHIIPKSKGGRIVRPCCWTCNQEKANMFLQEYITFLRWQYAFMEANKHLVDRKIGNARKLIKYLNR